MRTQCGCESEQGERDYHESKIKHTLHGNPVWLERQSVACTPDYGQQVGADVICVTYHDLVFRCVNPWDTMGQRRSKVERLVNYLITEPVMPELTP